MVTRGLWLNMIRKGRLYWVLTSLFLIGNAVWGLACATCARRQSLAGDGLLLQAVTWIGLILAAALPTVVVGLREADIGDRFRITRPFDVFVAGVIIGVFLSGFSGFLLEILLSLLRIRGFLGIPIEKWN